MSETPDNPTGEGPLPGDQQAQIEDALRTWGADEAAASPGVPEFDAAALSTKRRTMRFARQWGPSIAAAAMLLVSVWLYFSAPSGQDRPASTRENLTPEQTRQLEVMLKAERQRFDKHLADVKTELGRAVARADAAERLLAETANYPQKLEAELRKAHQAERERLLAEAERKMQLLRLELASLGPRLRESEQSLEAVRDLAERLEKDLNLTRAEREQLESRLAAMQRQFDEAQVAERRALAAAAQSRRADEQFLQEVQQAYLSAGAPGRSGLVARQSAARQARLLERADDVTRQVGSVPTRRLMDTLELLLTRLDLLEAGREADRQAFKELLEQTQALARIDEALHTPTEPARVRTWLLEVKLVLMGTQELA